MTARFIPTSFWLVACLLFCSNAVPAQSEDKAPTLRAGDYDLFRSLLAFYQYEPVDPSQLRPDEYRDVLVISLGTGSGGAREIDASRYTTLASRSGGNVLVARDTPGTLNQYVTDYLPLEITNERVVCDTPTRRHLNQSECPYITPTSSLYNSRSSSPTKLMAGLNQIATNIPGAFFLKDSPSNSYTLVGKLSGCRFQSRDGTFAVNDRPFAIGGFNPTGSRSLFLADPDIVSNQLLVGHRDQATDNLEFTIRMLKWLKPLTRGRSRCILFERGVLVTKFDQVDLAKLVTPDIPPIDVPPPALPSPFDPVVQDKLTRGVNRFVEEFQESDRLNRAITGSSNNPAQYSRRIQNIVLTAVLILGWLLLRQAWKNRQKEAKAPGEAYPTKLPAPLRDSPSGNPNRDELIQLGDYTLVVKDYLIELFNRHGAMISGAMTSSSMPKLETTGDNARQLKTQIQTLWNTAFGSQIITYSRWKEIEPVIESVQRAASKNQWRFPSPGT